MCGVSAVFSVQYTIMIRFLYGAKKKLFSLKNQVIYNKETALVSKFRFVFYLGLITMQPAQHFSLGSLLCGFFAKTVDF